jgi:hypothetical protein
LTPRTSHRAMGNVRKRLRPLALLPCGQRARRTGRACRPAAGSASRSWSRSPREERGSGHRSAASTTWPAFPTCCCADGVTNAAHLMSRLAMIMAAKRSQVHEIAVSHRESTGQKGWIGAGPSHSLPTTGQNRPSRLLRSGKLAGQTGGPPGDRTPNPRTPGRSWWSMVDGAADLRLSLCGPAVVWCRLASAAGVSCP